MDIEENNIIATKEFTYKCVNKIEEKTGTKLPRNDKYVIAGGAVGDTILYLMGIISHYNIKDIDVFFWDAKLTPLKSRISNAYYKAWSYKVDVYDYIFVPSLPSDQRTPKFDPVDLIGKFDINVVRAALTWDSRYNEWRLIYDKNLISKDIRILRHRKSVDERLARLYYKKGKIGLPINKEDLDRLEKEKSQPTNEPTTEKSTDATCSNCGSDDLSTFGDYNNRFICKKCGYMLKDHSFGKKVDMNINNVVCKCESDMKLITSIKTTSHTNHVYYCRKCGNLLEIINDRWSWTVPGELVRYK